MILTRLTFTEPKSLLEIEEFVRQINRRLPEQITSQPAVDHGRQYTIIVRPLAGERLSQPVIDELVKLSGEFKFLVT